MFYKWLTIVCIFLSFSHNVFSSDCSDIFKKLDKQHYEISETNRIKNLIKLENDLFAAIEQCKSYSGMFVLMGEVQIDMGQIPLAVVYGNKSVELDSKYWRAHKLLGSALMLNRDHERGLHSLEKSAQLNPSNINTKLNLASALIQNKKYDKALMLLEKIIHKNEKGTLATAYYLRSQAYKGKGLVIEADRDSKTAQSLGFALEQR